MYLLIKALALPPANLAVVIIFGLVLRRWAKRVGTVIAAVSAVVLYALSTSFVATRLLGAIEADIVLPALSEQTDSRPSAIVILSAGFAYETKDATPLTVDQMTLERLRMGARLHRSTGLPVLVTGGPARHNPAPMATLMQKVLIEDFGVEPAWVETRALTTNDNALYSAAMLLPKKMQSVYVVSQAWHLPRALAAFDAAGLSAVPAPSSFTHPAPLGVSTLLPSPKELHRSYFAAHEILGLAWYRWAYFDTD